MQRESGLSFLSLSIGNRKTHKAESLDLFIHLVVRETIIDSDLKHTFLKVNSEDTRGSSCQVNVFYNFIYIYLVAIRYSSISFRSFLPGICTF